MSPGPHNKNPWDGFKAEHREPKSAGIGGRILIVVFVTAGATAIGALIGALAVNFFEPQYSGERIQNMMDDTPEAMRFRTILGALVAGVPALIWSVWHVWFGGRS